MSDGVRWSVLVESECGKVKGEKWGCGGSRPSLDSAVSDHLIEETYTVLYI